MTSKGTERSRYLTAGWCRDISPKRLPWQSTPAKARSRTCHYLRMGTEIGVVVVTHDSGGVVGHAVRRLLAGTRAPDRIVIVDNASANPAYLDDLERLDERVSVLRLRANVGFAAANNRGLEALTDLPYVLLCNPDAFVTPAFLTGAVAALDADGSIGAIGPKLLSVDPATFAPTGRIDSVGIFQTAYGRVFDRGQREVDRGQHDGQRDVPALCAAAVLCRTAALRSVAQGDDIFDSAFFMYKEDVDLSYRMREAGWRLVVDTDLVAYHCRGWEQDRMAMPSWTRRLSLTNEWRLWRKGLVPARVRAPMLGYLLAKSVWVRVEDRRAERRTR